MNKLTTHPAQGLNHSKVARVGEERDIVHQTRLVSCETPKYGYLYR